MNLSLCFQTWPLVFREASLFTNSIVHPRTRQFLAWKLVHLYIMKMMKLFVVIVFLTLMVTCVVFYQESKLQALDRIADADSSNLNQQYRPRNKFQGQQPSSSFKEIKPENRWNFDELSKWVKYSPTCHEGLHLLILITSSPEHFRRRKAIRNTWCSGQGFHSSKAFQCVFMIAEHLAPEVNDKVRNETSDFKDILLGTYKDSYQNLTHKVLVGFHWSEQNCLPQYILKTDDDCFVNVELFLAFLRLQETLTNLYAGRVFDEQDKREVIRDRLSKWAVTKEQYLPKYYPRYAGGPGYLLSRDVLQSFVSFSHRVKPFPVEDAYMGVLAEHLSISPINSPRFASYTPHWSVCNFRFIFLLHGVPDILQYTVYTKQQKAQSECSPEIDLSWG